MCLKPGIGIEFDFFAVWGYASSDVTTLPLQC